MSDDAHRPSARFERRAEADGPAVTLHIDGQAATALARDPMEAKGPLTRDPKPRPYTMGSAIGVPSTTKEDIIYFRQIKRGNIIGGFGREPVDLEMRRAYGNPQITLRQFT